MDQNVYESFLDCDRYVKIEKKNNQWISEQHTQFVSEECNLSCIFVYKIFLRTIRTRTYVTFCKVSKLVYENYLILWTSLLFQLTFEITCSFFTVILGSFNSLYDWFSLIKERGFSFGFFLEPLVIWVSLWFAVGDSDKAVGFWTWVSNYESVKTAPGCICSIY